MQGIENTIIEADLHPRPHVGESLVTSTTRVFEDIGFLETMERERFPKKWGAAWHPYTNRKEYALRFAEIEQEGIEQDYTYHVDRSRFDMLLLKHARSLGSTVHQGVDVTRICFEGDRAVGVLARVAGRNVEIEADIVVDASGRRALLGRQLGIYERDPLFNQHAVHGWFENVNRGEGDSANYIHIYFVPVERGWAWQIPINERITSVGVVTEGSVFRDSKGDVEGFFRRHVESNPALADALQPATRVNDLKREGDYSYSMKSFCGNGWLLVGDAARFVDPIFSSGVSVALYSARFASEVISTAVERNDFSAPSFQAYENRLRGGRGGVV